MTNVEIAQISFLAYKMKRKEDRGMQLVALVVSLEEKNVMFNFFYGFMG